METGNNGQFLHRQLLGRFLITETTWTFDLGRRAEMFSSSEPFQTVNKGRRDVIRLFIISGGTNLWTRRWAQIQRNVPKRIHGCRNATIKHKKKKIKIKIKWHNGNLLIDLLASLANHIRLKSTSKDLIDDTVAAVDSVLLTVSLRLARLFTRSPIRQNHIFLSSSIIFTLFYFSNHLQCRWSTSNVAIKNSCASCCS